jgi:hypothetical protein
MEEYEKFFSLDEELRKEAKKHKTANNPDDFVF